ncbi:MAG: phosphatase PAP2 family protein [Mesorhizobium sp.]
MSGQPAKTGSRILAVTRARLIEDRPLFVMIAIYVLLGGLFLIANDATDRIVVLPYLLIWPFLFGIYAPVMAVLGYGARIIHRFDRHRRLAFRRVFRPEIVGYYAGGVVLMLSTIAFQSTFTSIKNGVYAWQGGFIHDRAQADIDKALHFGVDPWRWLYAVGENGALRWIVELNYNVLWFVICYGALFAVAAAPQLARVRIRYFVTYFLTWIIGGNIIAGLFLSAGPAYYGYVTGDAARFAEQLQFLALGGEGRNSAVAYQAYLWDAFTSGNFGFASGISAFPSMHVAMITLNVLFIGEYSRRWAMAGWVYVAFVVASSVYLAWHYAIDGYASVILTFVIYHAVRAVMAMSGRLSRVGDTKLVSLAA